MFLHIEHIIMFHVINDFAYGIYSLFSPPNENQIFFFFLHILISFRTIM